MNEYIDNSFLTYSGSSHPILYSGQPIFIANRLNFEPDIIIKRTAGYAERNAVAFKDTSGRVSSAFADKTFPFTPSFFNGDKIMAVRSPYLIEDGNFNTRNCVPCTVTTGSSSPELKNAVYFDYPPSSDDYVYVKLPNLDTTCDNRIDLTNGGSAVDSSINHASEIIRCKLTGYQYNGAPFGDEYPLANLSDYTAVKNFYAPDLTYVSGFLADHYGLGPTYINDAGTGHNQTVEYTNRGRTVYRMENVYAPNMIDPYVGSYISGGALLVGPFQTVNYIKNVNVNSIASLYVNRSAYIEDFTANLGNKDFQAAIELNGSNRVTAWSIDSGAANTFQSIGFGKPTSLDITLNDNNQKSAFSGIEGYYSALSSSQSTMWRTCFGTARNISPDFYISIH